MNTKAEEQAEKISKGTIAKANKVRIEDRPRVPAWILATMLAVSAFNAESARGEEPIQRISEIRLGLLGHDVDKLWSHFREESGVDYNSEIIFHWPSASLFSGTLRPNLGININNRGDTDKLYAGVLWEYEFTSGVFLNLGWRGCA